MISNRTPFPASPALRAVAPFLDPRTWGAVAYVWLGFPLGLAWFIGMTVGFLTGAALVIVWVGLIILALTLLAAWGAEGLERRLAIWLLGARVPERREASSEPWRLGRWARSVAGGTALWKGLAFLVLRFPLGLAGWIVSVVSLSVSLALLVAPWAAAFGGEVQMPFWEIDTAAELWLLSIIGLVLFVATLHLHRGLGWVWARLAERLLGGASGSGPSAASTSTPPTELVVAAG